MRRLGVLFLSSLALGACVTALPTSAQLPPADDARGSWALGLAAQGDENSTDSLMASFNWGVGPTTWLSFAAGRSRSPADRANVEAETIVVGVDHRFDVAGFSLEAERWGDPGSLETSDLRGSIYFVLERLRLSLAYETRDIEIPFTLTGPLGGTLQRTAELDAESFSVDARVALGRGWQLYVGAAEHDYERNLALLPRIDRLNLLSASTLTLANSFIDHERSIGFERELGAKLLNVTFTTDRSAIDGSKFETLDAALLLPIARRMDLEINVGRGRSEIADAGAYAGVLLLIYGR